MRFRCIRGWPDQPYMVIGSIQFADPNASWDDGDTSRAASWAKRKGGDAIIIRYGTEYGVDAITGAAADPRVFSVRQVAALVITWKSAATLANEREVIERFEADFRTRHPNLPIKTELTELGIKYIGTLGLTLDSPSGASKLDEVLSEVLHPAQAEQSSKWLFKGTMHSSSVTASFTKLAVGLATVSQTAESITIVSSAGRTELHLSGSVKDGRLSGQLGVSSGSTIFSGKAAGVLVPGRISIDSQAQTADGILQSNFTFMR